MVYASLFNAYIQPRKLAFCLFKKKSVLPLNRQWQSREVNAIFCYVMILLMIS